MNSGMHFNDSHFTGEQIAALAVAPDAEFEAHARECAQCSAKVEVLRASLADFGGFVRENAERTNTFWWRQRAAVPPAHSFGRWAMAAAAVVVAAAVSVPFIQHAFIQPGQTPQAVQQNVPAAPQISDEALLGEVQSDVVREYPDAFAPVGTNAETAVATQMGAVHKKEHKKK